MNPEARTRVCLDCAETAIKGHYRCREHVAAAGRRKQEAREAAGQCSQCRRPRASGRTLCETHLHRMRVRATAKRVQRRERGLCTHCGKPARPGGRLCDVHRLAKLKPHRRAAFKPSRCDICGIETERRRLYCDAHVDKGLARERAARTTTSRAGGRCSFCGIPGHKLHSCRARRGYSIVVQDRTFEADHGAPSAILSLADAQPGDILVWLSRWESAELAHVTREDTTLTVRFGGRVQVLEPGVVAPVGEEGQFRYGSCPKRWRCTNRLVEPSGSAPSLDTPIADTFFLASARVFHVLTRLDLKSIGDLYRLGQRQLLSTVNFGRTSMTEVDRVLEVNGLPRLALPPTQANTRRVPDGVPEIPITQLVATASTRASDALESLGLHSVGDLYRLGRRELLRAWSFGPKAITYIDLTLAASGLPPLR